MHVYAHKAGLTYLRERVDAIYKEKAPDVDGEWLTNLHQVCDVCLTA